MGKRKSCHFKKRKRVKREEKINVKYMINYQINAMKIWMLNIWKRFLKFRNEEEKKEINEEKKDRKNKMEGGERNETE